MKNTYTRSLLFAATMVLTLFMASCHEDHDNEPEPEPTPAEQDNPTPETNPEEEKPNPTFFAPVTEWGCNAAYIKQHQQQGTLVAEDVSTNRFGEETRTLSYREAGFYTWIRYTLTRDKLNYVSTMFKSIYKDDTDLINYLKNNYTKLSNANWENAYFIGKSAPAGELPATVVGFGHPTTTNEFVLMVFMPWTAYDSSQPLF